MSTNKSIAKSAGLIGFATLCSRILGFIRDIIIARLFGIYIYSQAFVIAFKIPNLFRDFVAEGAANAAFVPVFSEYSAKHTKEEFWELANVMLNILLVMLTAITFLGIIFSPIIVRIIAPGFVEDPLKLATTVGLTRVIFPYILLMGLAAYAVALLNSLKHFAVPAFAPCLLNISIIVFALIYGESVKGLALGVLIGGVLQLAVQVPVLYKKGFRLKLFKSFRHPAAGAIRKLMIPRLVSSSIYQLNNFVDSIFGSLSAIVGEGGVSVLYFSYRLILFPIGVFSNAMTQAILPTLSTQALEKDKESLKHTFSWGLRSTFFVMIPASVVFMVLPMPIISAFFGGGKFDLHSAQLTANALFFYSIGLFAYGSTKVVQSCFFALKDTVTPAKVAAVTLVMNIILNPLLMFPLKISGIALANSISGIVTFFILLNLLSKRLGGFPLKDVLSSFLRILAASLLMGVVCHLASGVIQNKYLSLGLALSCGALSYIAFCFLHGVTEMRQLWRWIIKRFD